MENSGNAQRSNGKSLKGHVLALFGAGILSLGLYHHSELQEFYRNAKDAVTTGMNTAETVAKAQLLAYLKQQANP